MNIGYDVVSEYGIKDGLIIRLFIEYVVVFEDGIRDEFLLIM